MKGSWAFSANSRTVLACCFLNCSSNMTKPQTLQTERSDASSKQLRGKQFKARLRYPWRQANSSAPAGVNFTNVPGSCNHNQPTTADVPYRWRELPIGRKELPSARSS